MAISDRISAMYDHVGEIYDTLELGGDTTQNKNIVNINTEIKREYKDFLANGTDTLWNNWEKVSGTGTELSLNNTMEGKMKVDLKGNTYQYTTTGKNLFDISLAPSSAVIYNNGFTLTKGTNRILDVVLPKEYDAGTYTLNFSLVNSTLSSNSKFGCKAQTASYQDVVYFQPLVNGTFTANQNFKHLYFFIDNAESNSATITIDNVMLSLGNTPENFEKYTGEKPAPSPDYPQDIQVVSGDNTIKVEGKNLCITSNWSAYTITNTGGTTEGTDRFSTDYIPSNENVSYTLSLNGVNSANFYGVAFYSETQTYLSRITKNGGNYITFTTPENTKYIRVFGQVILGETFTYNKFEEYKIQLEKNNTATTYTPYVSQTYPISLGNIELCKIGTYQDKIAKSSGKNLFDKDNPNIKTKLPANGGTITTGSPYISTYLPAKEGDVFTLSSNSSLLDTYASIYFVSESLDTATTWLSRTQRSGGATSITATAPQNTKYVCFYLIYSNNQTTINSLLETIMINKGTTALPYEPYGKVWYLNKQIGKVVLDGSEFWNKIDNSTPDYIYVISTAIDNIAGYGTFLEYSNYFSQPTRKITPSYVTDKPVISGTDSNEDARIRILVPTSTADSLNNFKIWLSTHNTTVYYVLATPTYEEITDTTLLNQLNNLYNANSYNNTTNVSQVNDDLASILDVTALEDIS